MEYVVLGWPPGPKLRLDWRRFSYAGKFVMTSTGKAVARDGPPTDGEFADEVVGAAAFNEDRTDPETLWIRYVTVAENRRGEGVGAKLCAFVAARAREQGYKTVQIAVNNPYSYEALYKAGFGFTGRETGIAELVLAWPTDQSAGGYHDGLARFPDRDISSSERAFLDAREGPPEQITAPGMAADTTERRPRDDADEGDSGQ